MSEPDDAKKKELKAQLEDAMRRKQEMLQAQREGFERKQAEAGQREDMRQREVREDTAAAAQRSAGREEWRQEKHASERTAEDRRRKEKMEAEHRAEEERKKEAAKKKQQEYLDELHRNAVKKRVKARHESAVKNEEFIVKRAEESGQRSATAIGSEEQYKLAHFESERKRRLAKANADKECALQRAEEHAQRDRQLAARERRNAETKKSPHAESDEQEEKHRIERDRRKAISDAEETWNETCRKINAEMDQFVREVKRDALVKRDRSQKLQRQRTDDAKRRRKAEDEYLGIEPEADA